LEYNHHTLGTLNRVPALAGGKSGKVTAGGWQVTLRDPIWHVISRSGEVCINCYIRFTLLYFVISTGKCDHVWVLFLVRSNQSPRSTQPGHPSVSKSDEYQLIVGARSAAGE